MSHPSEAFFLGSKFRESEGPFTCHRVGVCLKYVPRLLAESVCCHQMPPLDPVSQLSSFRLCLSELILSANVQVKEVKTMTTMCMVGSCTAQALLTGLAGALCTNTSSALLCCPGVFTSSQVTLQGAMWPCNERPYCDRWSTRQGKVCGGLPGYAAGDMGPEVRLPGAALEGSLGPDSLSGQ